MLKQLWNLILILIGKIDWKVVAGLSIDMAKELADKTPSTIDDKAVDFVKKMSEMAGVLDTGTAGLSSVAKKAVADTLNKNNSIIPALDVQYTEKDGFKVSTKITF